MLRPVLSVLFCLAACVAQADAPSNAASPPNADAPSKVMIVGTFHFANPGRDQHNVDAVDVMNEEQQAELARIATALGRFAPTLVAVEWPADVARERYSAYRAGTLNPSPNEVVQLGFRLAAQASLATVHGIDVDGEFPYEPLQQFADENDMRARLDASGAAVGARVKAWDAMQREKGIGAVLRDMNTPESIRAMQAFYADALRYGREDVQPGVALNVAWAARNYGICARLLQAMKPGERAVVFYGSGHAHALRQCVSETPGVTLVEATEYLPVQ